MDLGTFQAQKRGNNRNNNNRGKQPFYSTSQNKQNGDWKRNATCHFCGKKGHIKPDCRAYQA